MLKWVKSGNVVNLQHNEHTLLYITVLQGGLFAVGWNSYGIEHVNHTSLESAKKQVLMGLFAYFMRRAVDVQDMLQDSPEWVEITDDHWQYRLDDDVVGDVVVFPDDGARWWGRVGCNAKAFALLSDAKAWVEGECL